MGDSLPRAEFELGDWLVEPSLCRVSKPSCTVHLRPKLMDVLVCLATNHGRVVSKDEILAQVWHGEFVVESVLPRSIADLRYLLGDDATRPRLVETIARRGYRLIAPVRWRAPATGPPPDPSIAVLPFADMTGVRDQQYLCDGLAEELTNTLSGVPGLRVIARTSAFAFRGAATDIREIGRQLGASRIVEGAVQRVDERLRITVQLIDTADACHVWSRRFDCPAADLFAIEDEIARAVAAEFTSGLPRGGEWSMRRHSRDAEAHDLYLRGLYIAARRTGPALREAAVHYQRAIERDPTYAVAHAALAECHGLTAFFGQVAPADGFPRARAAAEAALRLDPTVAEGHTALAAYRTFYEWKWDEAEQGFRRAITLNPSYPLGRMLYSHLLAITGRAQEAWEQAEAALRIDPWSLTVRVTIGLRLGEVRMFDRALDRLEATLAMDPTFALARLHIGRIHLVLGRYEEALTQFRAIADEFPLALAYLGNALGRLGRTGEAADILQKLKRMSASRYVGALPVALIHQGLGNFDAALDWYAKAFDAHDGVVAFSSVDPIVDELRGDPRFDALVRRLRLPSAPATDRSATVTPESSRS